MVWDIPSTKQEQKCDLLQTKRFIIEMYKSTEKNSCRTQIFVIKNGKKLNRFKTLNTSFFEDIYLQNQSSHNL